MTSGTGGAWLSWPPMTETEEVRTEPSELETKAVDEAVIDEAVRLIDNGLSDLLHRELVSSDEVSDLLLDVRTVLKAAEAAALAEAPVGADA